MSKKHSKKKSRAKIYFEGLLLIAIVLLFALLTINLYIIKVSTPLITNEKNISNSYKTYDTIIVPGARVYADHPSLMLKDRLDQAIVLYNLGVSNRILVSGDHGQKSYDEVNTMRNYLVENGIPIENIFMDHAGFNTYSTFYRAKKVFMVESAIISTQKYHLFRSLYIADKMGIAVKGTICDQYLPPSMLKNNIREILARLKAFIEVEIIKPEPKYLGDSIPISGSGISTEG